VLYPEVSLSHHISVSSGLHASSAHGAFDNVLTTDVLQLTIGLGLFHTPPTKPFFSSGSKFETVSHHFMTLTAFFWAPKLKVEHCRQTVRVVNNGNVSKQSVSRLACLLCRWLFFVQCFLLHCTIL
jgi:hypothetical protein